ncbi:MAG: RNA polymerase sigma factor [Phycisphaerales bacterium]|nr:RNA polymerase sigma factor [Phycisphaerales bacterium]
MTKHKQPSGPVTKPDTDEPKNAKTGGMDDFAAQFERSSRILWLIAAGTTGDRSMADDIVQEATVIALSKLEQFKPGTNFTAWMGQMVRHVAMNTARKEHRRRSVSLDLDSTLEAKPHAGTPDQPADLRLGARGELPADQGHFDDRIMQALHDVSDVARACLLLKTLGGLDYAEISRVMEIPEGTAMSHVHRTRQFLRGKLANLWRDRTSTKRTPS